MGDPHYAFGRFVLRPGRELLRDGTAVPLGNRALSLLEALVAARGAVLTKADIMERVWPGLLVEDGNITVQVTALRKALGQRGDGGDWIVTVPRVGYRLVGDEEPAHRLGDTEADKPALAVLPFVNLSETRAQDYLADGLVEDLINAFGRFKSFAVVSRQSSFALKGRVADIRDVAGALGVRYLLEGSLRVAGERIRVTAQLVDAAAGTHLWAESFDGELKGIFEFQDEITQSVVGLVEPQIRRAEIDRVRRRPPDNPRAYDLFLRALPHFYGNDPAGYVTASGLLERAIALQPDYAQALAYASWSLLRRVTVSLTALQPEEDVQALELARTALIHGADDPVVLAICGHSLVCAGRRAEGLATVRRALAANPNNVLVQAQGGTCNMLVGDLGEAEDCYRRVHRLSPGVPEAYEALAGVGFTRFFSGDYDAALHWLDQSRASLREWPPVYWMTIAASAHSGRIADAKLMLSRLMAFAPQTRLAGIKLIAERSDGRWDKLISGLAAAGLA